MSHAWKESEIERLRSITRECQFDFDLVATRYRNELEANGAEHHASVITASLCREVFAADFEPHFVASIAVRSESEVPSVPMGSGTTMSSMGFHEAMDLVEKHRQESLAMQEEVFRRVHESLGGASGELSADFELPVDVASAWSARQSKREADLRKRETARRKREENMLLGRQREQLRNRFAEGSEDAEGVDPLQRTTAGTTITGSLQHQYHHTAAAAESPMAPRERELVENFRMNDFLESDQFLEILESLVSDY